MQQYSTDLAFQRSLQSHGGVIPAKPTSAHFIIFPITELLPREKQQVLAFKKRDIPTVRLHWLVQMKRFRSITSWTQWAMDPTYQVEPLVEDQELAVELGMLGVENIEDESINMSDLCKSLSKRVSSDAMVLWCHGKVNTTPLLIRVLLTVPSPPYQVV